MRGYVAPASVGFSLGDSCCMLLLPRLLGYVHPPGTVTTAYNPVHNSIWTYCPATGLLHAWRNPGLPPWPRKPTAVEVGEEAGADQGLPAAEAAAELLQALGEVVGPFVGRPTVRGLPFGMQSICEGWTTLAPRGPHKSPCVVPHLPLRVALASRPLALVGCT